MASTILIQRTIQYTRKDTQYINEVVTIQEDNQSAIIVFSIELELERQETGFTCTVNHHTPKGIVYHRKCFYSNMQGPFDPANRTASTLVPEFRYLMHLYLQDGWLLNHGAETFGYGSQQMYLQFEEEITMKKHIPLSETKQRLDVTDSPSRRNILLDLLREWNLSYQVKRQGFIPNKTENISLTIYDTPLAPTSERYIICTNYAYPNGTLNNAAGLALLLDLLRLNRSDVLSKSTNYVPPMLEVLFLDGETGAEGARQHLWSLSEEERKSILGVINLELCGSGNQLIASCPYPKGNGKLLTALCYQTKHENRHLVRKIPSPLNPILERDAIPLVTICNVHSESIDRIATLTNQEDTANQSLALSQNDSGVIPATTLEDALAFVREVIRLLSYVKGDEFEDMPNTSFAQNIQNLDLLKSEKQNNDNVAGKGE